MITTNIFLSPVYPRLQWSVASPKDEPAVVSRYCRRLLIVLSGRLWTLGLVEFVWTTEPGRYEKRISQIICNCLESSSIIQLFFLLWQSPHVLPDTDD